MSTGDAPFWCETCQAWVDHSEETHPVNRVQKARAKHRGDNPESMFIEPTPLEFREVLTWTE